MVKLKKSVFHPTRKRVGFSPLIYNSYPLTNPIWTPQFAYSMININRIHNLSITCFAQSAGFSDRLCGPSLIGCELSAHRLLTSGVWLLTGACLLTRDVGLSGVWACTSCTVAQHFLAYARIGDFRLHMLLFLSLL